MTGSLALLFLVGLAFIGAADAKATDDQIRDLMIQESIARYPGSCPCPYNIDRAGRRCGGRSAYSRPGGYRPLCYRSDIGAEAVAQFRRDHPGN